MVPITITGRSAEITHGQKEHAKEKVQKLERYFNGIMRIEAILDKHDEQCRAELVISVKRGGTIVVHCDNSDLYAAIDLVLDKAENQLTRHKEKLHDKRKKRERDTIGAAEPSEDDGLESYDEVIEKQDFD